MFNANGMSVVQDVRISRVSVTGENEILVNLTYTGNGSSPSITIVAMTNHMAMMNMMMSGGGEHMDGGMMSPGMMDMGTMNHTEMMGANCSMMMNGTQSGMMMTTTTTMAGSQKGSSILNSCWQSGSRASL